MPKDAVQCSGFSVGFNVLFQLMVKTVNWLLKVENKGFEGRDLSLQAGAVFLL